MLAIKPELSIKKLQRIQRSTEHHWVGDGFPVRTLLGYSNLGPAISPFLLFDYAGPMEFPPTEKRLGVGEHPHRGFETVTIVYGSVAKNNKGGALLCFSGWITNVGFQMASLPGGDNSGLCPMVW